MNTTNNINQPNFKARLCCNLKNPDTRWKDIAKLYAQETKGIKKYSLKLYDCKLYDCYLLATYWVNEKENVFHKISRSTMNGIIQLSNEEVVRYLEKFTQIVHTAEVRLRDAVESFSKLADSVEIYAPDDKEIKEAFHKQARKSLYEYAEIKLNEDKVFRDNVKLDFLESIKEEGALNL